MASARTYWFGPKRFGWGLSPKTWQGWVSVLVYAGLMIGSSVVSELGPYRVWDVGLKIVLTGGFFALMAWKYDAGLR